MTETTQDNNELYSLLVPLHEHRLLVPRACVAEVIGFSAPEPAGEDAPGWLLGMVTWNSNWIPIVSFEGVCGLPVPEITGRSRIVVFFCIAGELKARQFGVVSNGFPQLVRVNEHVLKADDATQWADPGAVICQIRMINEVPLIPDLEFVEQTIHQIVDV